MIRLLQSLWRPRVHGFKTVDDEAAERILRLHREHPEMGRRRLRALLTSDGVNVDPHELKIFLRSHHIGTPPPTRQRRPRFPRVLWIPWIDYRRRP